MKEPSWATSWGTREGKEGKGVKLAMLILYVFFVEGEDFLVGRCGREREK
jgi:hypothetical protein